jgi:hypothetical protein
MASGQSHVPVTGWTVKQAATRARSVMLPNASALSIRRPEDFTWGNPLYSDTDLGSLALSAWSD